MSRQGRRVSINSKADVRSFEMAGIGLVKERILEVDHDAKCFRYSAFSTPANIEHHLATIRIVPNGDSCLLHWTIEISPDLFAGPVYNGMQQSITGLRKVLGLE